MNTISFLPIEEMRILKQIIIVSDFPKDRELSVGYIVYERILTDRYKFKETNKKSDGFDYIRNIAFNGYYNLKDQHILNKLNPIVFY